MLYILSSMPLLTVFVLTLAIPMGGEEDLIVVSVCMSLMTSDVRYLFMNILAIRVSS